MRIDVDRPLLKSLLLMGAVVEARDAYTGGHLWRVSRFSRLLAESAGLARDEVARISVSGFLHDLGKVGVPDAILNKPAPLTDDEYGVIKTHPDIGGGLIAEHPLAVLAQDAIRHHHERIDGGGYPDRLSGPDISSGSRIVAVADVFDALTSTRPYHAGVDIGAAIDIMQRDAGRQFDSGLLDRFAVMAGQGALDAIVGHSDDQVPLVECPHCGPVMAVSRSAQSGDVTHCRVCATEYRLHRQGPSFVAEATGRRGNADQLKPAADSAPIDELIIEVPRSMNLEN